VRALRGATKQCVDELDFTNNPGHALPTTDHVHDFEALDSGVGSLHRLKATGRPEDSVDTATVCLDDVVQVFRGCGYLRFVQFRTMATDQKWAGPHDQPMPTEKECLVAKCAEYTRFSTL